MQIEVLLFATFADIAGDRRVILHVEQPCTVLDLVNALQEKFPQLCAYDFQKILVAVNQEMAEPDRLLSPEDEVGVFPPVSGGLRPGLRKERSA